jgi:hypothetical protein
MFVIGRIVPLHPATEAWLVSGNLAVFPKSTGKRMAQIALEQLVGRPELMRRNPSLLSRAWEIQAQHREEFIAQVGADLVILPPREAEKVLWKHYDRLRGKGTKKAPPLAELGELPEKLLAADTVALIYDDVEGLSFFHDFGCLDDLFADPALARDRTYLQLLRGYLRDESVSPLAIRRLVSRHPNGADRVFRALLRRPSFSWTQDGEKLLERHKKSFLNHEPMPAVSVVGGRLAELLGTSR